MFLKRLHQFKIQFNCNFLSSTAFFFKYRHNIDKKVTLFIATFFTTLPYDTTPPLHPLGRHIECLVDFFGSKIFA